MFWKENFPLRTPWSRGEILSPQSYCSGLSAQFDNRKLESLFVLSQSRSDGIAMLVRSVNKPKLNSISLFVKCQYPIFCAKIINFSRNTPNASHIHFTSAFPPQPTNSELRYFIRPLQHRGDINNEKRPEQNDPFLPRLNLKLPRSLATNLSTLLKLNTNHADHDNLPR